jgi:hypothetical protein
VGPFKPGIDTFVAGQHIAMYALEFAPYHFSKAPLMRTLKILATASLGLAVLSFVPHAHAACATSPGVVRLSNAQISNLLAGKLVCGRPGASYPGTGGQGSPDRWQEEHLGGPNGGDLWDYKLGPGHPIDPRKKVGTWSPIGTTADVPGVIHRYDPPGATNTFNWTVWGPEANTPGSSVYSFCLGAAEHVRAYVVAIGGACGAFP